MSTTPASEGYGKPRAIICTLGLNRYTEVSYQWNDGSCRTPFVQEALVNLLPADRCYVLTTPEVADPTTLPPLPGGRERPDNLTDLRERLGERMVQVDIPSQQTPERLWEVFNAVTATWPADTCVVLDVTNAFRYLPILLLAAAVYLRTARGFEVERIVYGRYEEGQDTAPIIDITQFLDLMDWTVATDQFVRLGNAEALASRLPGSAKALAGNISEIARGMHLLRPLQVMQSSARLPAAIGTASTVTRDVPPFGALLQAIETGYGAFGLEQPADTRNGTQALVRELRMIRWYASKQQYVHALSLAREWVISLLCQHFNLDPLEGNSRDEMERLLGAPGRTWWDRVPHEEGILKLWNEPVNLRNLRNDVLHGGFRKKPKRAENIVREMTVVLEKLQEIAVEWGLEGSAS